MGVDGTASSTAALAWAMRLAAAHDWVVEAVTAWPDPPHDPSGDHGGARKNAVSVLSSAIVSAELRLATTRPTVISCVDHGDPVDALVARSSHARLLVLGEHDAGRRRLVSVADSCTLLALCPVVVVQGTDVARAAAVDRDPS